MIGGMVYSMLSFYPHSSGCEQYHIVNIQLVDVLILILIEQSHFILLSLIDEVISSEQCHLTISKNRNLRCHRWSYILYRNANNFLIFSLKKQLYIFMKWFYLSSNVDQIW